MGAELIGGAVQGLAGIGQAIGGAIQAHRAQKKYEKLINSYVPNQGIMDFYTKALNRYSSNPYQSSLYRQQQQTANRGLATGINALHGRRSNDIASLVQGYNDSSLRAATAAEGQQAQALSQLGQATGMKAAEEKYPFELKANMLAAKAAGGAQIMNAGLSNIYGGANNLAQMYMTKKLYEQ